MSIPFRVTSSLIAGSMIAFALGNAFAADDKSKVSMTVAELDAKIANSASPSYKLFEARGDALLLNEEPQRAFDDYSKAIEVFGQFNGTLLSKRANAALLKEDYKQALEDWLVVAKQVMPPQAGAYASVAMILAGSPDETIRDPGQAIKWAKAASALEYPEHMAPIVHASLAAAYAAEGDFELAVSYQQKAIASVKDNNVPEMRRRLELYKAQKEFRFAKPFDKDN